MEEISFLITFFVHVRCVHWYAHQFEIIYIVWHSSVSVSWDIPEITTNTSIEMSLPDLQVCRISPIVPHTQVERLSSPIVPMLEQKENNKRAHGGGMVKRWPRVRVEMVFAYFSSIRVWLSHVIYRLLSVRPLDYLAVVVTWHEVYLSLTDRSVLAIALLPCHWELEMSCM
jgi:hypothetical protein